MIRFWFSVNWIRKFFRLSFGVDEAIEFIEISLVILSPWRYEDSLVIKQSNLIIMLSSINWFLVQLCYLQRDMKNKTASTFPRKMKIGSRKLYCEWDDIFYTSYFMFLESLYESFTFMYENWDTVTCC